MPQVIIGQARRVKRAIVEPADKLARIERSERLGNRWRPSAAGMVHDVQSFLGHRLSPRLGSGLDACGTRKPPENCPA
jgi:hypothetical protein